jgi:oxalate decarboxylase
VAALSQGQRAHDGVRQPRPRTTDEFAAGDVGYVPQGYGHYIENTGSDTLEIVLALNNATYQSISITAWMAANPDLLLSTNFGVPESVFAKFPKGALIMPK